MDMSRMKKKYVFILGKKDEILRSFDNTVAFAGNMKQDTNDNNKQKGSGYLVLLLSTINEPKHEKHFVWTANQVKDLKHCKKNICTAQNAHHGSKGYYASFGMKANYAIVNQSSLAKYTVINNKNLKLQKEIILKAEYLENLLAEELLTSTLSFKKYLRNITDLLSPVINEAFECQKDWGNICLNAVPTTEYGLWQSQICIDASTSTAHTEKDCTYTLISVPNQQNTFSRKVKRKSYFLFVLNDHEKICIPLTPQVTFFFSGMCLVHRQNHPSSDDHAINFLNIASYGNERLFNHIRSSFNRVKLN